MLRRIEESIDLDDGHALGAVGDFLDAIAGAGLAFLYNAAIKPGRSCVTSSAAMSGRSSVMPIP